MIRCRGNAPDGLTWLLGARCGLEPFLVYRGDVLMGGAFRGEQGSGGLESPVDCLDARSSADPRASGGVVPMS
jgi:hypothetical protein